MSEYISRKAALRLIDQYWKQAYNAHYLDAAVRLGSVYRKVEDIPAADVRRVRRGKWIDHQEDRWIYAKCSECGTVHDVKSNFCPNCGATMLPEPPKEEE